MSLTTDDGTLRRRLQDMGVPQAVLDHENRGRYLIELLRQRTEGEETSVVRAAEQAGVKANTVRIWRKRSEAFGLAEHRARWGNEGELPIAADAPCEPEQIKQLRARLKRYLAVCESVGAGPWSCSPFQREQRTGFYTQNRQGALETIAELRRWGVTERFEEPPPLGEYPKPRFKPPSISGTGLPPLWPPSANPAGVAQWRAGR